MTRTRKTTDFFVAGGALRPNAPSYVKRPADDELFELTCAGQFAYVLTARQMGKTSLMHRTARRLKKEAIRTVRIDLTNIGTVSVEKWYLGVLVELSHQLRLPIDLESWWQKRSWLGTVQRFNIFLRDVVLSEIQQPVVIFIDEIDVTLGLGFSDDFFAAIRSLYNARAQDTTFERLTFVLLGVASPSDLIKDRTKTPFNIGQGVLLQDFSLNDAATLEAGLIEEYPEQGEAIFTRIYDWTDGHPYLTQKLCQEVMKSEEENWTKGQINELVEETFLSDRSLKDDNLRFAQDKILTHPEQRQLLGLYRQVHNGKKVADDAQSLLQNELKLSGLVKVDTAHLRVRNEIYWGVFDLAWVRENTKINLYPIMAVFFALVAALAIGYNIYNSWIANQVEVFIAKFYQTPYPEERVTCLAQIFQMQGAFGSSDYDHKARELFYSLSRGEQLALFETHHVVELDMIGLVQGLNTTLADVDESDSTRPLLKVMDGALEKLFQTPQAVNEPNEIDFWLQGRLFYRQAQYNEALAQYDLAFGLNSENPATLYERARVLTKLSRYQEALANLESIVAIANRTSVPTTPTPGQGTSSSTFTPTITLTPKTSSSATSPDQPVTATPTLSFDSTPIPLPTATPVLPPFTSEFDTPGKMIGVVRNFIQNNRELVNALANTSTSESLNLLGIALLPPTNTLIQPSPTNTRTTSPTSTFFTPPSHTPITPPSHTPVVPPTNTPLPPTTNPPAPTSPPSPTSPPPPTPTSTRSPAPTETVYEQAPQPRSPLNDDNVQSEHITFEWRWSGAELQADHQFLIRGFRDGEWLELGRFKGNKSSHVPMRNFGNFETVWQWYIVVIDASGKEVSPRSKTAQFFISLPSGTPSPTVTRRTTLTRSPTVTLIPSPTPSTVLVIYPPPQLLVPEDGGAFSQPTLLQWSWEGTLQEDEYFDVRVWRDDDPVLGIAWTKETSFLFDPSNYGGGNYFWTIAVIRGQDGTMLEELSAGTVTRSFNIFTGSNPAVVNSTSTPKPVGGEATSTPMP